MRNPRTARILIIVLSVVSFLLILGLIYISKSKIVYVDSNKLLAGYKGMVNARAEYSKKEISWKSNIDTLTLDVKNAMRKYNEILVNGTDKEKKMAKDLIGIKQKELYDYQNAIKQNASEEQNRINEQVLSTINTFLDSYGRKHHYKFILIAANGNIGYADKSSDITSDVVDALNKDFFPKTK